MSIQTKVDADLLRGKCGFQAAEFDSYVDFETAMAYIRELIARGVVEEIARRLDQRKLDVVLLRPISLESLR